MTHRTVAVAATATAVSLLLGCGAESARLADGLYTEIHTNKGTITARLDHERTPLTVANFVGLAEGTIDNEAFDPGRPYYDASTFHRVEPGHVIQTGIADSDRSDGPGYTFPNEIHAELSHDRAGMLNMANGGPHTNAAQFTVTLGDRSYLDGDYIVFGEVVDGMDVVSSIVQGDVVDSVRIVRVGEQTRGYESTTDSFHQLVADAEQRVARDEEAKRAAETEWLANHYPDAAGADDDVRTVQVAPPSGPPPADGPVRVRYRGTMLRYMAHRIGYQGPTIDEVAFGSDENGQPGFFDPPREFVLEPGTTINPGLDSVLADLQPGEHVVAIVPSELGYGEGGLYTPETPGEPRFVVSPNTLLVYEVEAGSDR